MPSGSATMAAQLGQNLSGPAVVSRKNSQHLIRNLGMDAVEEPEIPRHIDKGKIGDAPSQRYFQAKVPSLAGMPARGGRAPRILLQTMPARHTSGFNMR